MSDSVKVTFEAEDRVTDPLEDVQGELKQAAQDSNTFWAAFGGAETSAAAIVIVNKAADAIVNLTSQTWAYIKASEELTSIQQDAERQLEAVERSMGSLGGWTSENIKRFASLRQEVTLFGDEVTIKAAANLATYGNIQGEVFKETLAMGQDMAQFFGSDLFNEITGLGKALNDPLVGLTALAKKGVAFTDEQKTLVRSLVEQNRVMEAQKIILGELSTQFSGQATSAIETHRGKVTQLDNAYGDFRERMGEIYQEMVSRFLPDLETFDSALNRVADSIHAVFSELSTLYDEMMSGPSIFEGMLGEMLEVESAAEAIIKAISGLRVMWDTAQTEATIAMLQMTTPFGQRGGINDEISRIRKEATERQRQIHLSSQRNLNQVNPELREREAREAEERDRAEAEALARALEPGIWGLINSVGDGLGSAAQRIGKELTDNTGKVLNEIGWRIVEGLEEYQVGGGADGAAMSDEQRAAFVSLEEMGKRIQQASAGMESPEVKVGKQQVEQQKKAVQLQQEGLKVWMGIKQAVDGLNLGLGR